MAEGVLSPTVGARLAVPLPADNTGGASPAPTRATPPLHQPWRLPARGLAVFHGAGNVARLSHYFLPRLLMEGKRVLFLDGANSADPRLLERFARERSVPFERFNRGIQIARAFTCFQLTELIARVPMFLADFPAEVVIVTAFPDLYFDEDVRDWNARVAFEQGLANLRRWAGSLTPVPSPPGRGETESINSLPAPSGRESPRFDFWPSPSGRGCPSADGRVRDGADLKIGATENGIAIAVFSAMQDFAPPPVRQRFFPKLCAAVNEVWRFNLDADNRLKLIGEPQQPRLARSAGILPAWR